MEAKGDPLDRQELSIEERQEVLQREIAKLVAKGYQVQSSSATQAVLSKKKKIRLITHILIAVITVGVWLLVILWQMINRKQTMITVSVDEFGKVRKK